MRRVIFFGCLLAGLNALAAMAAIIVIGGKLDERWLNGKFGPRSGAEPTAVALAVNPAEAATEVRIRKAQDRIAPSHAPGNCFQHGTAVASGEPAKNEGALWSFGGENVSLHALGSSRRFYFIEPRSGFAAKFGDLAFDGVREGPAFSGLAFLYTRNCAPLPYAVRGGVSADGATIALRGMEPRRDARCRVVGSEERELVFTRQGEPETSAPRRAFSLAQN